MTSKSAFAVDIAGGRNVASAGLLSVEPGGPSRPLSAEDIRAISGLRRVIEPDMARRSAGRLGPRDVVRLEEQLRWLADPANEAEAIFATCRTFHLGLLAPVASNVELHVIRQLLHDLSGHYVEALRASCRTPADILNLPNCLVWMLREFRSGDPDRAEASMLYHIDGLEKVALRFVEPTQE